MEPRSSRSSARSIACLAATCMVGASLAARSAPPSFGLTPGTHLGQPAALLTSDGYGVVALRLPAVPTTARAIDMFNLAGGIGYNDEIRRKLVQVEAPPFNQPILEFAISADACRLIHFGRYMGVPNGSNSFDEIDTCGSALPEVHTRGGAVGSMSMSRNGQFAFVTLLDSNFDMWLERIDLDTTPPQALELARVANAYSTYPLVNDAWTGQPPDRWMSDDGTKAAFAKGDGTAVITMAPFGSAHERAFGVAADEIRAVAMSETGDRIAVVSSRPFGSCPSASGSATMLIYALDATYEQTSPGVPDLPSNCELVAWSPDATTLEGFALSADGAKVFWSSDGSFDGSPGTSTDVFIADMVASQGSHDIRQLTNSPSSGYALQPRPDRTGAKLAYTSYDGSDVTVRLLNTERAPSTPALANEDPDFPHDVVDLDVVPTGHVPPYQATARFRDVLGLGPSGTKLIVQARTTFTGETSVLGDWFVQDFEVGSSSTAPFTSEEFFHSQNGIDYEWYVVRAIGQGVQLDVRDARASIQ